MKSGHLILRRRCVAAQALNDELVHGEDMEGKLEVRRTQEREEIKPGEEAMVTTVYDNNRYDRRLSPAWGFSSVVTAPGKTILFDIGGDGKVLLGNMRKLGIRPSDFS